jgi:hypothetical protein
MLRCPYCKHQIAIPPPRSRTARRNRRRAGVPLDWLYCYTCRAYRPPEAFSKAPLPFPHTCDTCLEALLAE